MEKEEKIILLMNFDEQQRPKAPFHCQDLLGAISKLVPRQVGASFITDSGSSSFSLCAGFQRLCLSPDKLVVSWAKLLSLRKFQLNSKIGRHQHNFFLSQKWELIY